jgi:peroxiredoxin
VDERARALKLGLRRLPELKLPSVRDGADTPLRPPGRVSPVLVLLHGAGCAGCRAYLDRLLASADEIAAWDGRVIAVVPASPDAAAAPGGGDAKALTVLLDPERTLAQRLGVEGAVVVIADQYGEIHHAAGAGEEHDLPAPDEVVEWLRYLAVQCPECQGEAL